MGLDFDTLLTNIRIAYRHITDAKPDPALSSTLNQSSKSTTDAIEYRKLGNEKFLSGNDLEALNLFTRSISLAVENREALALAYSNRSAVLCGLAKYELCLLDIDRALKKNLPQDVLKKLENRKKQCLLKVESKKKKIVNGNSSHLADDTIDEWRRNFANNPLLPNTSSKIELACDERWGRYMVAVKDIEPGEILSIEEFFSSQLNSDRIYSNCAFCFVKCETLISCPSCSKVMYCSNRCRDQAYKLYHRTECKLWPFYESERLNAYTVTAIQTFLVGTKQGADLKNLMMNLDLKNVFKEKVNPIDKPFKNDYSSILKLLRTFGEPSKDSILFAVKVIVILRDMAFFRYSSKENSLHQSNYLSEAELFSTLLLINHLDSIKYHNFAISEITSSDAENNVSFNEHSLGFGVCALHNLVNHSCDPNIGDFVRKREHAFYALRPIQKGQQIFTSYCNSFAKTDKDERVEKLSSYGFNCRCKACVNSWPKYTNLPRRSEISSVDQKIMKDIMAKADALRKGAYEVNKIDTLDIAITFRKLLQRYVRAPSAWIIECEEWIMNFMRRWYGNSYVLNETGIKDN